MLKCFVGGFPILRRPQNATENQREPSEQLSSRNVLCVVRLRVSSLLLLESDEPKVKPLRPLYTRTDALNRRAHAKSTTSLSTQSL